MLQISMAIGIGKRVEGTHIVVTRQPTVLELVENGLISLEGGIIRQISMGDDGLDDVDPRQFALLCCVQTLDRMLVRGQRP